MLVKMFDKINKSYQTNNNNNNNNKIKTSKGRKKKPPKSSPPSPCHTQRIPNFSMNISIKEE